LFFFCVAYINLNITKPLNELVTQAKEMSKGNINVKVKEGKVQNTISVLARTFNDMAQNIRAMMESIQENVKVEKKLLEEELKNAEYINLLNKATFLALQSQTNPHFLFNTLNSISRTISLKKEDQALLMIDSLAALLRYNLTDAEIPVTLSQELSITNEYLKIQRLRFSDRLQSHIICKKGLDTNLVLLPRFTLQPLVENAIIHGLQPKAEGGHIMITVKQRGEYCIIKIGDNGIGISEEKLKIIAAKGPDSKTNSIGIWNTKERVRLFTNEVESFTLKSREKVGTVITIKLYQGERNV
jgi:sensor histidine kinase YesM